MKIQQDDKEFLLCFFAGQAMQGILASADGECDNADHLARASVLCAKALLKELEVSDE